MTDPTWVRRIAWECVVRRMGGGIVAGTVSGIVGGIGARLAMRVVALVLGAPTGFSLGGTLNITLMAMCVGITPGIAYAVAGRRLPGPPLLKGFAFGVLLFVAVVVYPLVSQSFVTQPDVNPPWLRWLVFGTASGLYGLVLGPTEAIVTSRMPIARRNPDSTFSYAILGFWGLAGTAFFLTVLASVISGIPILGV
jgi:hypothetical protein